MKRLWSLMLALALAGGILAEEAPAGSIDMMYLNLNKFVFGRPTLSGHLTMAGAEAIIRLHLEHANYCVSVAINTDTFSPDKVTVIRNMLTPWLLNQGVREVYFRSSVTGDAIGAPVKTMPVEEQKPLKPVPSRPVGKAPAQQAATPAPVPAKSSAAVIPGAPVATPVKPEVKLEKPVVPETPAVKTINPAAPLPVIPDATPASRAAQPLSAPKTEKKEIQPAVALPAAKPTPAAVQPAPVRPAEKVPAPKDAKLPPLVNEPLSAPAEIQLPGDLPEAPEPLKTTPAK